MLYIIQFSTSTAVNHAIIHTKCMILSNISEENYRGTPKITKR